jgi:glutathione S-transferase
MSPIFHERIGLDGRRISPFSWRIRYAFAHKGLEPEVIPTRFADVGRIRALSGQDLVPIVQDGDRIVHDSWAIACYLEDRYPDRPSLFGGEIAHGTARLVNHWAGTTLGGCVRRAIAADFVWVIDLGDRAHYRRTREAQFGMTLEQASADRAGLLAEIADRCRPLEQTLREQPFVAGAAPAYADYIVFSIFQWARIGAPFDIAPEDGALRAIRAWRERMVGLHGQLGNRFALYPTARSGPDGR